MSQTGEWTCLVSSLYCHGTSYFISSPIFLLLILTLLCCIMVREELGVEQNSFYFPGTVLTRHQNLWFCQTFEINFLRVAFLYTCSLVTHPLSLTFPKFASVRVRLSSLIYHLLHQLLDIQRYFQIPSGKLFTLSSNPFAQNPKYL